MFTSNSPLFWSTFSTKTKWKTTPTLKAAIEEQRSSDIGSKTQPLRVNHYDNHQRSALDISIRVILKLDSQLNRDN